MTARSGCDGVSTVDLMPIVLVVGIFTLFLARLLWDSFLSRRID